MEARDEGHRDGPQGGVDEHHEVGQRHRVPQHSQGSRARNHLDAAALQRSDRPGRAAQGVHAREHGAQVAARVVVAVGQRHEECERAQGDDDGAIGRGRGRGRNVGLVLRLGLGCGCAIGVIGGRHGDGLGQGDDVNEVVADGAADQRYRLSGHLAQPQAHALLDGVSERLTDSPAGAVGQTQLRRRRRGEIGERGQLDHLPDSQVAAPRHACQLADPRRVDTATSGERAVEDGAHRQGPRRDDAWRGEHRRRLPDQQRSRRLGAGVSLLCMAGGLRGPEAQMLPGARGP